MIKFCDKLNDDCKNAYIKNFRKSFIIAGLLTLVVLGGIIALIAIFSKFYSILFFELIPILTFLSAIFDGKKNAENNIPQEIIINDGKIVFYTDTLNMSAIRDINKITTIKDNGKWYAIYFSFPHISFWVCQKDLIKEGTIEEFEEFFKDKLVKK